MAIALGEQNVVLVTGARSEVAADALCRTLDPMCLIEVGDFTGVALRGAALAGIRTVVSVGMVGRLAQRAPGVIAAHFRHSEVATGLLAAMVETATETATAWHIHDACMTHRCLPPPAPSCEPARAACMAHAISSLGLEVARAGYEGSSALWRAGPWQRPLRPRSSRPSLNLC